MDYMVFRTRKEALEEIADMRGWDAKIAYIPWPEHPLATRRGNVIVIECDHHGNERKYLREDGFVR